jgi:hypothetical protein
VQALNSALSQTELLQQHVQRSGWLSSESIKDRLGECMENRNPVVICADCTVAGQVLSNFFTEEKRAVLF